MKAIGLYILLSLLLAGCVAQQGGGVGHGSDAEGGIAGSSRLITITCAVDHRARSTQVAEGTTLADYVDSVIAAGADGTEVLPSRVRVRRQTYGAGSEQIHEFSLRQVDASDVRLRLESFTLQEGDFIVFTYPIP